MSDEVSLPETWTTLTVGDAVRSVSTSGKKIPQHQYQESGAFPIIDQGQQMVGGFTDDPSKLIDCEPPAIVFGDHTKVVKLINSRFAPGADGVKVLKPHVFFDPRMFKFLLDRLVLGLVDKGYARHFQHLAKTTIPLPPLAEQKRIVAKIEELFSELEAGEESLRVARRQLGVYRQSLLKQAFEGKLTQKWRTQNPAKLESPEALLARLQSARQSPTGPEASSRRSRKGAAEIALEDRLIESLPRLPEFWQWTALGNLAHLITKGSSPKWQGFDYTDDANGVLFVTSENVRTGYLDLSRPKYLGLGFNEIQPASVLKEGDVLLNIVGASIGRAAVFNRTTLANINQAVSVIRPTIYLDRAFLTYHLNSSRTYQLVTSKAVDVARANFSLADVNEIPVPLCSLPEQQEIVRLLDEQFEVIERNERELDAALQRSEALRQAILKKAFTGRLVPQSPADEPATQLLARLRAGRCATLAAETPKALTSSSKRPK